MPLAVTALGGTELASRQITRTLDLANFVPNMVGHQNTALGSANGYSMRGLGSVDAIPTFDAPVGTYVDDVYMARQGANNFAFFDIERIEVLRGPQGTLFGRNTTGGAINVVLKKPGEELGGFAELGYGRYNRVHARGSVDVPVVPGKLLTKVSAYYSAADGFVENQTTGERLNDDRSWGVRGAVRSFVHDSVTWDFSADYNYIAGSNLVHFYDPSKNKRFNFTRLRTDTPIGPGLVSEGLADLGLGNKTRSHSLISNISIDAWADTTLNLITGYRYLYQEYVTDSADSRSIPSVVYDNFDYISSLPGTTTILASRGRSKQFTQEVKLAGKLFEGAVDYVGGFFFLTETNSTSFANANWPITARPTVVQDRTMDNGTDSIAFYLQADWKLGPLTATAGVRYTEERKDVSFEPNPNPLPRASASNQPFDTADLLALGIPTVLHANVWTPRVALSFAATDDIRLFASATKGFKSGGWNARANYAAVMVPFDRETVWSYEGGVRSDWLDNRLRVNLTGFYFTAEDFQLPAGYLDPVTNTITYLTRNFATLRNYGLEGEISAAPVDGLNLYWTFGLQRPDYIDIHPTVLAQQARCRAGITANNCNAGIVTASGEIASPVRAPRFGSTLGGSYRFGLGDFELTPSASWTHNGGSWAATSNDVRGHTDAYDLINMGLTFARPASGWSLTAECSNCFDTVYKTSFLIYPYLNAPGRWIVRGRYEF